MKDPTISGQAFSLLTVAIMVSSAWFVYSADLEELNVDSRVPVWARGQLDYQTDQAYSFVLQQGEYQLLETGNEFDSEHVYVEYELPIGEGGAAITCEIGMDCPQISLAYWRPKVPTGMKVPVIAEFGPYFGETSAQTPDVSTPGSWLGVGIIQNILPHGFAFAQVSVTGTGM